MEEKIDFGINIKRVRLKHKLTQAQFAEIIGKSPSTLHGYENNIIVPPFDVLLTISQLFDIPVGTLLGLDDLKENVASAEFVRKLLDMTDIYGDDLNETIASPAKIRALYDFYIKLIGEECDE